MTKDPSLYSNHVRRKPFLCQLDNVGVISDGGNFNGECGVGNTVAVVIRTLEVLSYQYPCLCI